MGPLMLSTNWVPTQQAGNAVGGVLERMSQQASGPQAAETPGASKPSD